MDDEDPLAWISAHCHVSTSQVQMLNSAPYVLPNSALGSERMSSSEDDEAEGTLVMVSVSETSAEEEYRTPPERHTNTLTSSNEGSIGTYADGGEDEVDCGGHEDMEKTVDLSRDSEVFGSECHRLNELSVLRDEDVKMEEDGFGEVTRGGEGRQKGNIEDNAMDEDLMMEEGGVPSSACRGAGKGVVEPVAEGNHGSSVNAETEFGILSGDVSAGKVNELQCNCKDIVDEVERNRCTATCVCVSDNVSSKFRLLPSSFCIGNKGDYGAIGNDRGSCRVRTDKRDGGVETGQGGSRVGACGGNIPGGDEKGVNEQVIGDADDENGKKPSQTNEKVEPNGDEQTENILRVLGLLAKPLRPVYKEKVDIIGCAMKVGITFPRPSWWPDDSDDDSN